MSSVTKRTLRRPAETLAASPTPASKRQKTAANSRVPSKNGLGFLIDEDARAGRKLTAQLTNGVPRSKAVRVDESKAVLLDQPDVDEDAPPHDHISISSGVSESSEYESDGDEEMQEERSLPASKALLEGRSAKKLDAVHGEDEEMEDAPAQGEDLRNGDADEEERGEPTLGDLLRARDAQPIDVQTSLPELTEQSAMVPSSSYNALGIPASTSLFTFLTQSLKTNDQEQLERCFQVKDLNSVRATIQRLQSHLVATLLKRIAERIHKRPGRMAQLMVWVQWSLVTHGGYLAGQPDVMKKLRALSQVVRERAAGLQPLLHVKGKLDMLSSQLVARKAVQAASRGLRADDEEDEEAVTYVEGHDDDLSEDQAVKMIEPRKSRSMRKAVTKPTDLTDSDEDDADDEIIVNGVTHDSDDDDDEEEGSEEEGAANGMFDMEAEETSDDEADEEAEEDSDADEDSDAESEPSELSEEDGDLSDNITVKQAPLKTLNRKR